MAPMAFAYNTSVHRSIKTTPFFLTHGVEPRYPSFPNPDVQRYYGESQAAEWYNTLQHCRQIAVQQAGAHPALQLGQIARHHGAGHIQFLSGAAQAPLFDYADKDPQCGQSIHVWLSICSICATVMRFLCCICTLSDPIHCVHQMNPRILNEE